MARRQIRYFLAVAQTLNFTRAAEERHVAQPSLTRAVKLLEAELGSDLFRRERNLTYLTDFGQRMLPLMRQCLECMTSAKRLAEEMKSGTVAPLTIALSRSVAIAKSASPCFRNGRSQLTILWLLFRCSEAMIRAVMRWKLSQKNGRRIEGIRRPPASMTIPSR